MDTEWFGLLVAAGTALGLRELIAKTIDWFGGRSTREKSRVQEFITERDAAREEAECLRDYVSYYRAQIEELGGGVVARPGWPCVPYKSRLISEEEANDDDERSGTTGHKPSPEHRRRGPAPHRP